MKSMLTVFAIAACLFATSCDNDNDTAKDKNTYDSIGNPSSDPSSTSVLTDDSADAKIADSSNMQH